MSVRPFVSFLCLILFIRALGAADFEAIKHDGVEYDVVRVRPKTDDLRVFWKDPEGRRYGSLGRLKSDLQSRGGRVLFAMNGGIFGTDYAPLGLFVENGKELIPVNRRKGSGNFFLQPNGIFYLKNRKAQILPTVRFENSRGMSLAVQSGPLLVWDNRIHPAFIADSDSRKIRNGVGISESGDAVFVMSRDPINFYAFASFFRDQLKCRHALYLDGTISQLYAPALGRESLGGDFASIIAVVEEGETAHSSGKSERQ